MIFRWLFLALLFWSAFPVCAQNRIFAAGRPNIIFFLVDDMGWSDTSLVLGESPSFLNRRYRTPNMERMAAEGIVFTHAYANNLCTPTRVSLFTGISAVRHRVVNQAGAKDRGSDGEMGELLPPDWAVNGLQPIGTAAEGFEKPLLSAEPLSRMLQSSGYATFLFGQKNLAPKGTPGDDPKALGFDVFRDYENHAGDEPLAAALTKDALAALEEHLAGESGKPFFLFLSHYGVREPLAQGDPRYLAEYDAVRHQLDGSVTEQRHASLVAGVDKSLGDVLDWLKEKELDENTLVIFFSDNGGLAANGRIAKANTPLSHGKGTLYEGGIRVPLIFRAPKLITGGRRSPLPVICEDLFPTILEFADVVRLTSIQRIDGKSLARFLRGRSMPFGRLRPLCWHFPSVWKEGGAAAGSEPTSVLLLGEWKLVYDHASRKCRLFELTVDPGEKQDVSGKEKVRVRNMTLSLTRMLKEMQAQMPVNQATGRRVPYPDGSPAGDF